MHDATPASLREAAAHARRHAKAVWPHAAGQQLMAYAEELEQQAAALEQAGCGGTTVDRVA
ncbi:MAG TPA: hypothetical protein VFN42_05190 [Acetobacteraceae bacterium]|nr:hypothetical protein [Acetobacteraceae bacterium]